MTFIAYRYGSQRATRAFGWLLGVFLACLGGGAFGQTATNSQVNTTYRLQPTDIVIIEVVNEPALGGKEFRVSATGEVSYPFIGAVKVGGKTPVEVQQMIKDLLEKDYLVNAQVLVQVKEFRRQQISVVGQVNRPGLYDLPPERRMTVMEAIANAGGLTRLARTSDIQLTRAGKEPQRFKIEDLRNPSNVIYLEPGDVINVPESRI